MDPRARVEFKRCVRELQRLGKTLLISSHIVSELAEMCDSFLLMDRGRVLRQAACDELAPPPAERRLVYEFSVAGCGGEALQAALQLLPDWREPALLAPDRVRAVYAGEPGEPLALQLRGLAAEHLLLGVAECRESLEKTVINLMDSHE